VKSNGKLIEDGSQITSVSGFGWLLHLRANRRRPILVVVKEKMGGVGWGGGGGGKK
jgi:hypothetical protein